MDDVKVIVYLIIGIIYLLRNNSVKRKSTKFSSAPKAKGEEDVFNETAPPQAKPLLSWKDLLEELNNQASKQCTPDKVENPRDRAVLMKTEVLPKATPTPPPQGSIGEMTGCLRGNTAVSSKTMLSTKPGQNKPAATEKKLDRFLYRYDGLKKAVVMSELLYRTTDHSAY